MTKVPAIFFDLPRRLLQNMLKTLRHSKHFSVTCKMLTAVACDQSMQLKVA